VLSREEKVTNFDSFIKSKKFGIDTWMTIQLFKNNTHYILTTVELYGILIKRLDEGNIPNTFSSRNKVVVKQFILLDVIMKLEILIECILVLIHCLSKDRIKLPKVMVYYDTNLIRTSINKIRDRKYNMEKILGLLKVSNLPLLSREERKYLACDYSEFIKAMYKNLDTLVEFYENYRLIYGKTKHGLTIIPGLNQRADPNYAEFDPEFEDSLALGHDIKRQSDLPMGYYVASKKRDSNAGEFFNTMTCVKFNNKLIAKIAKVRSVLDEIVPFICDNHMNYAQNCGESYLPYFHDQENNKIGLIFSNSNSADNDVIKIRREITQKIIPLMNIKYIELTTISEFNKPEIVNSLRNNIVTNIWKPFKKKQNIKKEQRKKNSKLA